MRSDTRSFYVEAVQQAIGHIAGNLDRALDLHTLASLAHLSPFHFHRVFRGMAGETPLELGRRLRTERAAWQLRHTDLAVTAIAMQAGYETHEAFTRAFRACYGAAPSKFRNEPVSQVQLAATSGIHFSPDGGVPPFIPRDSGGRFMDVTIKQMPARRVAAVEYTGPYHQISKAFTQLGMIAGAAGLTERAEAMIGLYYDDPETTRPEDLRADAGLVVAEDVSLPEGLVEKRLPAGAYACAVHEGPYTTLGDTWARLMGEWLPASGHQVGPGAAYESYVNTPQDASEEALRTELYLPLA